jgi:hypothetical protein
MMTIVTRVRLKEGTEPEWDGVMRERLSAARQQPGWVGGQLLMPLGQLDERVIVGRAVVARGDRGRASRGHPGGVMVY